MAALERHGITLQAFDVLIISHKIVSKSEGRVRALRDITPSKKALELAVQSEKDPRIVQAILDESTEVLRVRPGLIISRHRSGAVGANAGIDQSNIGPGTDGESVLCLPINADASANVIHSALNTRYGTTIGVVICDSVGRAWRRGVIGQAIGVAGLPALVDRRGELDRQGRELKVTYTALGDQIASAAELLMGEANEGQPVVLMRGLRWHGDSTPATDLVRPHDEDLFP